MTTYCHCECATKVAVKVLGRNAWRGKPWGDLGKQTQRVRTWHVGADCSNLQVRAAATGKARLLTVWTAVYDGHSVTVRNQIEGVCGPRNQPCTRAHRRDTTVMSHADTCTREQQAWTESTPALSASAVGGGAEWCGRTSTRRTRVTPPSSWPTGAAGEGTMECQPGCVTI